MNILLISNTKIILQIFNLISTKMNLELTIQDNNEVDSQYDLILIDNDFIDDRFNIIKQFSKKLGAITSEELPFEKARDFIVPRPFLPLELEKILEEQIKFIKDEKTISLKEQKDDTVHVTDYIESLADDIVFDIDDESDESIVTIASMKNGGVLDSQELGRINCLLYENDVQSKIQLEKDMDSNDWKNLSQIIDDALNDVQEYEFNLPSEEPIILTLNNHNIDELKPLLTKFDQNIIEKLSNGESIDIKISLKDEA